MYNTSKAINAHAKQANQSLGNCIYFMDTSVAEPPYGGNRAIDRHEPCWVPPMTWGRKSCTAFTYCRVDRLLARGSGARNTLLMFETATERAALFGTVELLAVGVTDSI